MTATSNRINVPVKLDSLDNDSAVFRGVDEVQMESNLGPFGVVEHEVAWPAVMIPRDVWNKLGCPSMLMVDLSLVEVPEGE